MRETITISIPEKVKKELDKATKQEGLSRSDIVRESLRDYLFIRRFRSIRNKMTAKSFYTDKDIFDRIS